MPKYRVLGGSHSVIINGKLKRYEPGQIVEIEKHEAEPFLDKLREIPERGSKAKGQAKEEVEVELDEGQDAKKSLPIFEIIPSGGGWYDIVDTGGEIINQNKLRKSEAEKLVQELIEAAKE